MVRLFVKEQVENMEAPATAAAVANQFLKFGERDGAPIDQMKLQKLLFYAHAWHLAINEHPLFEEDFEAWPWGPVVRNVYAQTNLCGRNPIPIGTRLKDLEPTDDNQLKWKFVAPDGVSDEATREFLEQIWNVHKNYSGVQLSNSTHAPGEPWTIVRDFYGSLDSKPTIPNDLIKDVFKKKLKKA
jgi:uncharacterized phage-associated protein